MPDIHLLGPQAIEFYKNITAQEAGGAHVYMGGGGVAPPRGVNGLHPGRWLHPNNLNQVSTTGGVGHFLAIATDNKAHKITVGNVVVLYQNGHFTHVAAVASDQLTALGAEGAPYANYYWAYVLAMSDAVKHTLGGGWAFTKPGGNYIAHHKLTTAGAGDLRDAIWRSMAATDGSLLNNPQVSYPTKPTTVLRYSDAHP
jgi:hypothetical protein